MAYPYHPGHIHQLVEIIQYIDFATMAIPKLGQAFNDRQSGARFVFDNVVFRPIALIACKGALEALLRSAGL